MTDDENRKQVAQHEDDPIKWYKGEVRRLRRARAGLSEATAKQEARNEARTDLIDESLPLSAVAVIQIVVGSAVFVDELIWPPPGSGRGMILSLAPFFLILVAQAIGTLRKKRWAYVTGHAMYLALCVLSIGIAAIILVACYRGNTSQEESTVGSVAFLLGSGFFASTALAFRRTAKAVQRDGRCANTFNTAEESSMEDYKRKRMERLVHEEWTTKKAIRAVVEREHGKQHELKNNMQLAYASGGVTALVATVFHFHVQVPLLVNAFITGSLAGVTVGGLYTFILLPVVLTPLTEQTVKEDVLRRAAFRVAMFGMVVWTVVLVGAGIWITHETVSHGGTFMWTWLIHGRS